MDELNPTVREQEIYEEMELTPEMVKSIRTLCGTCLRHFVDAKAFKIALVPSPDRSMDTCTVCQMRRGKNVQVAVAPLVVMSLLFMLVPSLTSSTSFMIIPSGALAIGIAYSMYRKQKKEADVK